LAAAPAIPPAAPPALALPAEPASSEVAPTGAVAADVGASDIAPPNPVSADTTTAPAALAAEASPRDPAVEKVLAEITGLREKGRMLKALHVVRGAVKSFPKEPALLQELARAAQESKAWGEARRAAVQWVAAEPSSEARLTLARLERATGNTEKGLAIARAVAKDDPSSEEARRLVQAWAQDQRVALNR
jgi:hypothetical protein